MKLRIIGAIAAVLLALVGAGVLVAYVGAADSRAMAQVQLTRVYVIAKAVPKGTPANKVSGYLREQEIPAVGAVSNRVTNLAQIGGLVTNTRLEVGEQLLRSRWVSNATLRAEAGADIPKGYQALTLALPVERAYGGRLQAGDRVGVVITSGPRAERDRQVLHKVQVLSVQTPTAAAKSAGLAAPGSNGASNTLVTLALKRPDVERVVWGQQFGSIYLTLEPAAADEGGHTTNQGTVLP